MISKIELDVDGYLAPVIVEWSDEAEDYLVNIPAGITRCDLKKIAKEIDRITGVYE